MSYVVLAGFILGISAIIIHEEDIWKGFIILAVAPPAVAAISIASTFFLGLIIDSVGRLFRIDSKITTSLVLLATIKNYGLAGGLSLAFFGKQTELPATVSTIFMFIYSLVGLQRTKACVA
jgi:predicted Na+-dependent transporter